MNQYIHYKEYNELDILDIFYGGPFDGVHLQHVAQQVHNRFVQVIRDWEDSSNGNKETMITWSLQEQNSG